MKKFYMSNLEDLNKEESKNDCVSYGRIVERFINNLVLANNIIDVDNSIFDNLINYDFDSNDEIFQYYLCNIDDYAKEKLIDWGFVLSYSDLLDLDVLCVDHFGTSWDYVMMSDVKPSTNLDEC